MTGTDILIGSILEILNDTTKLVDLYNGTRVGSFFFGTNQKLSFARYMPKGKVVSGERNFNNKSFGTGFQKDKTHTVEIVFTTKQGDVGSGTTKKNEELCLHYEQLIEDALTDNKIGGFSLIGFGDIDEPAYIPATLTHMTIVPVVYLERY